MKFAAAVAFLAGTVVALPTDIERRQSVGSTVNELTSGACRPITFIFARGSTENGNIVRMPILPVYVCFSNWHDFDTQGSSVGPPTCRGLKATYGANNVACQGVGSPYDATLGGNVLPEGTTTAAYGEAQRLFNLASTKCPNTKIVAGGYSQGAAVMVASVRRLSTAVQNKIAGVVLYGNTRNAQEGGKIPNFPAAKALTFCNLSDGVCGGGLVVTAGHLTYQVDVPEAVDYLEGRITAAGGI
jgi:cutinase